jgi:hypothetical protein
VSRKGSHPALAGITIQSQRAALDNPRPSAIVESFRLTVKGQRSSA